MSEKSVEPLIAAARLLELSARRDIGASAQHFAVASATRRALQKHAQPQSWRVSPRKLCGPRVEKSRRINHGLASTALWPQDGLEETRFPILCGVLQGEANLPMGDYCLQLPAEHLVFIPAGVPHPDGSQPHLSGKNETDFCDLFWLYRWEGGLICHICHSRENLHANHRADENCFVIGKQSIAFFDSLSEAVNNRQKAEPPFEANSEFAALVYLLPALLAVVAADLQAGRFVQPGVLPAGEGNKSAQELSAASPGERRQSAQWKENFGAIMHAQNYVAFHLHEPLTLDGMAQMACMSRTQFTQLFRRATGQSFVQYLTKVRLERAKDLLCNTDWNVEIIAHAVGWRGAHLWKIFARELGVSPGEFRRKGKVEPPIPSKKPNQR